MKKISIILITILLLITNFSVIFADETETDETNEPDTTEKNESNNDTKIEEIETNIKDINIKLNNFEKSVNNLESLNPGNSGILTNFSKLSEIQINWYYNNYNKYALINIINSNNNLGYCNESDIYRIRQSGNYYFVDIYKLNIMDSNGNVRVSDYTTSNNGYLSLHYYPENISDEYTQGYFQLHYNNVDYYSLTPYKLIIRNNGLSNYSISPNYHDTLIYANNETITISYNDELNDFTGYYDINGDLISNNLIYTFNINENTNLIINFNNYDSNNYDSYLIYIMLLLSFIVLSNLFNGGKLYD